MKKIDLIHGDAEEKLEYLINKGIQVDHIICDPPYNINYLGLAYDKGFIMPSSKINKVLKPNGNLILFQGWDNVNLAIDEFKKIDYKMINWIIWGRMKGRGSKKNLISLREDILWLNKNDKDYVYNNEFAVSNIEKKTKGLGTKNGCKYRKLGNVWYDISPIVPWSKEKNGHPNQKPQMLMERIVKLFTNENDLILDFCMGGGSTGRACKTLNRRFIGIEKEKEYYDMAANFIKKA